MRSAIFRATILGLLTLTPGARGGEAVPGGTEISVADLAMRPGAEAEVVVSGAIQGESTFGVTVMLELVPRSGAIGSLGFTQVLTPAVLGPRRPTYPEGRTNSITEEASFKSAGGVDIVALRDPWPRVGNCTVYDTDQAGSPLRNGMVDDNGTFVALPVTFSGAMGRFPVQASRDAIGVWDVMLKTSVGESGWEGVPTTLRGGTIWVTPKACRAISDCDDDDDCTDDGCSAGRCHHAPAPGNCLQQADLEDSTGVEVIDAAEVKQNPRGRVQFRDDDE